MKSRKQVLKKLFLSTLYLSAFTFGGGYVIVTQHSWLSLQEFADLVTIAEMTPGPIAINAATFVGTKLAGVPGAMTATFGCILPSCFIVSFLAFIYYRYKQISALQSVLASLRPAVVALIASAGLSILNMVVFGGAEIRLENVDWLGLALFGAAFIALRKFKREPILVMICCGIARLLLNLLFEL